jgi:hypothetical protein
VERAVQAIGGVEIVMEHPAGSRIAHNLCNRREKLPLAFTDMWNEDRMPQDVDRLKRSSTELQRRYKHIYQRGGDLWHWASQRASWTSYSRDLSVAKSLCLMVHLPGHAFCIMQCEMCLPRICRWYTLLVWDES